MTTPHDGLPLGGDLTVGALPPHEFARWCIGRKIPGASNENGKPKNAECYAQFRDDLMRSAAERAFQAWLGEQQ